MAHYISSKFASFETTHALVDRDTGKMIGEPVRAATLLELACLRAVLLLCH